MNTEAYSIQEITRRIKRRVESDDGLRNIWVRGEISNFTHHSRGHMYFTLKDETTMIRAVMFAGQNRFLKFSPQNGLSVLAKGNITVYERSGQYQLQVMSMQPDGIGALYQAYEQLKTKLEKKGWFLDTRKKPIPSVPKTVGVITSPTGAAVRDIITTIRRRYPIADVLLFPVHVQGEFAAPSVCKAIQLAQQYEETIDVLIIGRGGGSIEELWAFNEEAVAEAIYYCSIPVVSAVGHETDYTIADFVADLRAPTPTAAAELTVPVLLELKEKIHQYSSRLYQAMSHYIRHKQELLERLQGSYAFRSIQPLLNQKEQELDQLLHRFEREMKRLVQHKHQQLSQTVATLDALSPLKVMAKGYSLVYDDDETRLYQSTKQIEPGQAVRIVMHDGKLDCSVWGIEEEKNNG